MRQQYRAQARRQAGETRPHAKLISRCLLCSNHCDFQYDPKDEQQLRGTNERDVVAPQKEHAKQPYANSHIRRAAKQGCVEVFH
jgi:hypothetical protein